MKKSGKDTNSHVKVHQRQQVGRIYPKPGNMNTFLCAGSKKKRRIIRTGK